MAAATTTLFIQLIVSTLLLLLVIVHGIEGGTEGNHFHSNSDSITSAYSSSNNRKKTFADFGPSPFVDEATGQCTLNPCDALGRARDELYSILDEKEKVQSQSQTIIGELQSAVNNGRFFQEELQDLIKFMDKRLRSLEQPGSLFHFIY